MGTWNTPCTKAMTEAFNSTAKRGSKQTTQFSLESAAKLAGRQASKKSTKENVTVPQQQDQSFGRAADTTRNVSEGLSDKVSTPAFVPPSPIGLATYSQSNTSKLQQLINDMPNLTVNQRFNHSLTPQLKQGSQRELAERLCFNEPACNTKYGPIY